jgi:hypothetical protein
MVPFPHGGAAVRAASGHRAATRFWNISRHVWSPSGHPRCVSHGTKYKTSTDVHGAVWWVECQYVMYIPGGAYVMEFKLELPSLGSSNLMPYVSVATQFRVGDSLRSPIIIPLDALARSQLNPDAPLTRRLSSFLLPQSKYDLQKFQRRLHTSPRRSSPTRPPLKSSLKCPPNCSRRLISEPSIPPTDSPASGSHPKSVRFKDKEGELEAVCLFRPTGRPSSISHPRSHSDTETETDTDSTLAAQPGGLITTTTMFAITDISPIPSPHTPAESNVHLESLTLLPARPPLLRGTIRVRNIVFEKCVAVRFTTDDWTTISESHARYVGPAPARSPGTWDIFAFTIPLQAPRTLLLAVRYAVSGAGEWWDNNGGANFRVVLAPATQPRPVHVPGAAPGFGLGGVSATAFQRRALVGACHANVAASKTCAYPMPTQRSLPVPTATGQCLSVL